MSFLKSTKPEYRIQLPISNKRVAYTSFNMRSERTLMMATTGGNTEEITTAVVNCLNDHIRTDGIMAEDLAQAECELLLLNMRAKSVGETVSIQVADPETDRKYNVEVKLNGIGIVVDEKFSDEIELAEGRLLKMKLPGINTMAGLDSDDNEFDSTMEVLARCFVSLVDEDGECYNKSDLQPQEIKDFFLELDSGDFQKITDTFFTRLPKLATTVKIPRKGMDDLEVEVEGLASFL